MASSEENYEEYEVVKTKPAEKRCRDLLQSREGLVIVLLTLLMMGIMYVMGVHVGPRIRAITEIPRLEGLAIQKLRSLGTAQLAYQSTNYIKDYGSFYALRAGDYIDRYETLDTIIDSYVVDWNVNNPPIPDDAGPCGMRGCTFTIIAYPNPHQPPLRTFAIIFDHVIRVYNPDNGNQFDSITTWDEARSRIQEFKDQYDRD